MLTEARRRCSSLTGKRMSKVNQKCFYYHLKECCCLGPFCKFVQKVQYVASERAALQLKKKALPTPVQKASKDRLESSPSRSPSPTKKNEEFRKRIRARPLNEYFSEIRQTLMKCEELEDSPKLFGRTPLPLAEWQKKKLSRYDKFIINIINHLWIVEKAFSLDH